MDEGGNLPTLSGFLTAITGVMPLFVTLALISIMVAGMAGFAYATYQLYLRLIDETHSRSVPSATGCALRMAIATIAVYVPYAIMSVGSTLVFGGEQPQDIFAYVQSQSASNEYCSKLAIIGIWFSVFLGITYGWGRAIYLLYQTQSIGGMRSATYGNIMWHMFGGTLLVFIYYVFKMIETTFGLPISLDGFCTALAPSGSQ